MTQEKKETILTQTEQPNVTLPASSVQKVPAIKPEMSPGEKWFDRLVYQALNYWANLGISLVVTDFFLHGKGHKWFNSATGSASKSLMSMGMGKKSAEWTATQALGTFSLNSGGNILLVPTKYLEDNKRAIVYWLNEKLGVDQTAADGHKLTPDEIYIECEQDKQSWGRMIGRRALGWAATTSTGMVLDVALKQKLNVPIMKNGELVTHKYGQEVFTDNVLKVANGTLGSLVSNPTTQRYMRYAALDWIYTVITSKILHATNGSHKQKMPHETGEPELKSQPEIIAAIPAEDQPKQHATTVTRKKDEDGFAKAVTRQAETAQAFQLGA